MKLIIYIAFFLLLFTPLLHAQVGVGTTSPDATLDIRASNQATPASTDGILIPKVDAFPALNPTAAQQGMLVYLTTTVGVKVPGFYYWDNTTTSWVGINSSANSDADWFKVGTATAPTLITDDMFHSGNVAIGKNTTAYPLEIQNTTFDRAINTNFANNTTNTLNKIGLLNTISGTTNDPTYGVSTILTGSGNGIHYGNSNVLSGSGTATHFGNYTNISGTGSGSQIGSRQSISNSGNGIQYGTSSSLSGSGTGDHYGGFTDLNGTGSGEQHGSDNSITNTGNGIHFGTNNSLSGSGTATHYGFNATMSGAGTGRQYGIYNTINNSGSNLHYGITNDLSGSGAGNHFGSVNTLSGTGTGLMYGVYNSVSNSGNATHYGSYTDLTGSGAGQQIGDNVTINNSGNALHYGFYSDLNGTGSGDQYGNSNALTSSGNGIHYGSYNTLSGAGAGQQYGNYSSISNSGNATHYGFYNLLSGTGTGIKYGSYSLINPAAGGTHYGVYSEVLKAGTNYAGYFLGNVSIGTTIANNYIFPASRGSNGQIMQTDGTGTLSWQSLNSLSWQTTGNSGTTPASNFFGTTDDQDIVLKRFGVRAGFIGNPNTATGNMNTSFGANSLINPSAAGTRNVAIGTNVLPSNTNGNRNVSIGDQSMFSNTTGTENTVVGVGAMYSSLLGVCNVAIGRNALTSNNGVSGTQGSNNTGVGYVALRTNTIGAYNTALGREALYSNLSGNNNVGIGYQAGYLNSVGNSSVFLGNQAGYNETNSNRLYISNSNVDATLALIYGEFDTSLLRVNGQLGLGVAPSAGNKLEVSGKTKTTNFQMTTGAAPNYILQSDASGNASWAPSNNTLSVTRVNLTAGQVLNTSGWQIINFNTVVFDLNTEFNTGTNRFTATKTGYYEVNAGYHTNDQSNTQFYSIGVYKNGGPTPYQQTSSNHSNIGQVVRNVSCVIYLTAGDYVEIYAENYQFGVTLDSFPAKTFFEVRQIR